jgi:hypothetical protein
MTSDAKEEKMHDKVDQVGVEVGQDGQLGHAKF